MEGENFKGSYDILIFDIDGTLYDINDIIRSVYDDQVEFAHYKMGISRKKVKAIFSENSIFPYKTDKSKSATEFFEKIGLDVEEWASYKNLHFNYDLIDVKKAINPVILEKLSNEYMLCAITSNTYCNAKRILERIGIDVNIFTDLITCDNCNLKGPFQKKTIMDMLSKKYSIKSSKMLSIGDRYDTDIRPMIELGGDGLLVFDSSAVGSFFRFEKPDRGDRGQLYKFYRNESVALE